jgi:hypothetical protein
MYDRIPLPAPTSLEARTREIEQELLIQHGPLHVPDAKGQERYFHREHNAIIARRAEATRRAMSEARYEGILRREMARLEAACVARGRLLEQRGLTDEQTPSLEAIAAQNAVLRAVQRMTRRLAELERAETFATTYFMLTDAGRAALEAARAESTLPSQEVAS